MDVVLEYKGDIREEDFFTMLNEDGLSIGVMMLDIRANKYLEEKIKSVRSLLILESIKKIIH